MSHAHELAHFTFNNFLLIEMVTKSYSRNGFKMIGILKEAISLVGMSISRDNKKSTP